MSESEQQNTGEQGRAAGNGAEENQPRVIHAGGEGPRVIHAGSEGRQEAAGGQERTETGARHDERADEADDRRMVRAGAEAAARTAGQTAASGARIVGTAADTVRGTTAGAITRMARNRGDGDGRAEDLQAMKQSVDRVLQGSLAFGTAAQQAVDAWLDYGRKAVDRNAQALIELMQCRSFGDVLQWQTELLKGNAEDWVQFNAALFQPPARMAQEAADRMRESARRPGV